MSKQAGLLLTKQSAYLTITPQFYTQVLPYDPTYPGVPKLAVAHQNAKSAQPSPQAGRSPFPQSYSTNSWSAYSAIDGQLHTKFRSPNTLSTRFTLGQYFQARCVRVGKAATSRLYARSHSAAIRSSCVCGACRSQADTTRNRLECCSRTWTHHTSVSCRLPSLSTRRTRWRGLSA